MIILGIDPGTVRIGYGIIDDARNAFALKDYGCLTLSKISTSSLRLKKIYQEIGAIIDEHKPDVLAIEELFFSSNVKTALSVGQARGVIILAAADKKIPTFEYTPLQVKQAVTGYGKADKEQIQLMVKSLLKMKDIPKPDDAADGLALAICHANSRKFSEKVGQI